MLTERHLELLEARGLDVELLTKFGVSASERGSKFVSIPFVEGGKVVNHKHRTLEAPKEFSQDAGAKKCFWNVDVLSDQTLAKLPVIITEGEFDAFAAIQSGFQRTVSVPDGAPSEAQGERDGAKYSYLADALAVLRDANEIILATDSDGPGVNLMNDLAIRLGKHRCKWVRYPQECKDLNDALMRYGQRGVVETLNRAQWMKVDGVYRMSELPPLPVQEALPIGIHRLEKHYKVRLGDFVVVTGIPSHGKSSFVGEVMGRMALDYDWTIAVASFEQRPQTDHKRNLRTFYGRDLVKNLDPERLEQADKWIEEHFAFIVPSEDDDATLEWILERCAAAIVQFGAKMIVIDPWNELDHDRGDMSETDYTGYAIRQFRKLASKFQVHVIVVAHPAKMRPEKPGQALPVPNLYDISGSAHWMNKSDVGIVIHRKDERVTLIRVAKSRYHDAIGVPGDLEAEYYRDAGRYEILPEAPQGYRGEAA